MNILIFFIVLLVLVIVHECGHFFAAKKFGIRVDEFGFGFPPKLFGKKIGETEYTFNLIPLGGFVKIFGENPNEENTSGPDSARSMINKPKWQQAIVLFGGVFANFLLAWLLFSVGFMSGLPASVGSMDGYEVKDAKLMVLSVLPDSPAQKAGLISGDKILKISSKDAVLEELNPEKLKEFIISHSTEELTIDYERAIGEFSAVSLMPTSKLSNGSTGIGISMDQVGIVQFSFFEAFWKGAQMTWHMAIGTATGLFHLVVDGLQGNGDLSSITGPVGMVSIVGQAYDFGIVYLLSFAALISINLAIINLVPFPALDGGRLLFLLIEKIKGSRLSPSFSNVANMVGFALLIILMLFVTYKDITKLM
ncbi:MAG: RIP metalloprotease RseP [Candidatus Pacebacteria bacterium]|nr:RIP metalloprotease RseP [Candidatus Paceibacterota bacterium]MCF7863113.1 RIP metalloprotease RseP [Candidatus Paceibacterota bacterium]